MLLRRLFSVATSVQSEMPAHGFDPVALQNHLNNLKYFVARTKVGKNLPVYLDDKNGGSKTITLIRRVYGDPVALAADLRSALPNGTEVRARPEMQQIVIKGYHLDAIRHFLTHKGF